MPTPFRSCSFMSLSFAMRLLALLCVGWSLPALAASDLPGGPRIVDCSKAKDPSRCEARIAARAACKDKRGDAKRSCMKAYVARPDCSRASDPKACTARQLAETACRDTQGAAHKRCLRMQAKQRTEQAGAATK